MSKKRRQYSAQYKFQVAMEAAKGNKTLSELSSETGMHPNQIAVGNDNCSLTVPLFSSATETTKNRHKQNRRRSSTSKSAG